MSQCVKSKEEVTECMTPTTCPSLNGDEDCDVLSEEGFEFHITSDSSSAALQEPSCSDSGADLESEAIDSSTQKEQKMEESSKKTKPWRRSGRARQREQRRRRLPHPSPIPVHSAC